VRLTRIHQRKLQQLEGSVVLLMDAEAKEQRHRLAQRTEPIDYDDAKSRCKHKPISRVLETGQPTSLRPRLPASPISTRVDLYVKQQRETQLRRSQLLQTVAKNRARGGRRSSSILSNAVAMSMKGRGMHASSFYRKSLEARDVIPVPVPAAVASSVQSPSRPFSRNSSGLLTLDHVGFGRLPNPSE